MQLIETVTLSTAAASLEFSSIPSDADDLIIEYQLRAVNTADQYVIGLFNGTTNTGARKELYYSLTSIGNTSGSFVIGRLNRAGATANTYGSSQIYIHDYTSSVKKNMTSLTTGEDYSGDANVAIMQMHLDLTQAVNSIALSTQNGNLAAGSTASLYKITKA